MSARKAGAAAVEDHSVYAELLEGEKREQGRVHSF